jgi:malic enzyme
MGISEGKITLYTAAAGVNPMQVRTVYCCSHTELA